MVASVVWTWSLDGWIIVAGVLCAVAAALVGNFLVLRRLSMLGDAISHAVLPGLAAAFFLSGSRSSLPMFIGAVIVGVLTALFTEWIRGAGKVDEGAAMGVVFTSLFALGLVMIVQAADHVDLDPGCVLYGAIEMTPLDTWRIAGLEVPRVVVVLSVVTAINLCFVVVFFKELKLSSFDPALATTTGFHSGVLHYALMTLVAITAVASFESVGNILVVAMFIVPPAAAYMLTDRLPWMIFLSIMVAAASAVLGHIAAVAVPAWFGYRSTTTAGMMAVAAGLLFVSAALLGPKHGSLIRMLRRRLLSWEILANDMLAFLYRAEERVSSTRVTRKVLQEALLASRWSTALTLWRHRLRGRIQLQDSEFGLTGVGRQRARALVRSHRLWEQYLVDRAGVAGERIHDQAARLEHFTDQRIRDSLDVETQYPGTDPHGSPIPTEPRR